MTTKTETLKATKKATTEVAGIEVEVDQGILFDVTNSIEIETVETSENGAAKETQSKPRNLLLHQFTYLDLANRNSDLYERLYKTFQPMGIAANRDELFSLIDRYLDWYPTKAEKVSAQNEKKRLAAQEKIKQLAKRMGLDITINSIN